MDSSSPTLKLVVGGIFAINLLFATGLIGVNCDHHAVFVDIEKAERSELVVELDEDELHPIQTSICVGRSHGAWSESFYAIPRGAKKPEGAARLISYIVEK